MTNNFLFHICVYFTFLLNVENVFTRMSQNQPFPLHFSELGCFFLLYLVILLERQAIATCGKRCIVFVKTLNGCGSNSFTDSARQINKPPRRIDGLCHLVSFYKAVIQHINLLLPVDCFGKPPTGSYL